MLISKHPAFLFLHVDKAAGSSIQAALQPFAPRRLNNRFRRRFVWLGKANRFLLYHFLEFPEHVTAQTVRNCLPPATYARLFKFAFVRNPWDRMVSKYAHLLLRQEHPRHERVKALGSFANFLEWELKRTNAFQHSYVCDAQGKLMVDFVGYFERLEQDFAVVCSRLKVNGHLPSHNISKHPDYRTYYTPATRDLVADHFKRDLEFFGYDFDGIVGAGKITTLPRVA